MDGVDTNFPKRPLTQPATPAVHVFINAFVKGLRSSKSMKGLPF